MSDEARTVGPLVRVVETCPAAPSQWDAWTADGIRLYLRYRHGRGRVDFGDGEQLSAETLTSWDDGSGSSYSTLEDFLGAAGLQLADGAEVRRPELDHDVGEHTPLPPTPFIDALLATYRRATRGR